MSAKKVLLLFGGTRIGDAISATSGFRLLCEKYEEVHWCHGMFASQCFDLFEHTDLPMAGHCMVPEFVVPEDIHSVDLWRALVDLQEFPGFDLYLDYEPALFLTAGAGISVWEQFTHGFGFDPKDAKPPHLALDEPIEQGDYIVVQGTTMSEWKTVPSLAEVTFPAEAREIGWAYEDSLPNTVDCKGLSLLESAKLIAGSKLFVGICSSMAVLAGALGKLSLQLHFDEKFLVPNGLTQHYHHGYDLIKPDKAQLQEAIDKLWKESQDARI